MCRSPLSPNAVNNISTANRTGAGDGFFTPPPAQPQPSTTIYLATDLSRTLATLIDTLLMLVTTIVWLVWVWDAPVSAWLKALGALALFYAPAILDAGPGSLGKKLLKIQIVTSQGVKPSLLLSLWRHSVKYVLHLLLPIVWKLVEDRVTGGRHLHDAAASTVVIERLPQSSDGSNAGLSHEILMAQTRAGAQHARNPHHVASGQDIAHAQEKSTTVSRVFTVLKNTVVLGICAMVIALFAQAGWSLYQESQNPTMSAISDAKASTKPLTKLLTERYAKGQSLELDWRDPALATLAAEMGNVFHAITMDPSGLVVLQIKAGPVQGRHIVLVPEMNFSQKKIKKWQCGSPDIEPALLPTGCKTPVDDLVQPKAPATPAAPAAPAATPIPITPATTSGNMP
jgi:uncharacterized RDD family membrane protein YckC